MAGRSKLSNPEIEGGTPPPCAEDGFRVLIDDSFFSLVFAEGMYVADVFVPATMHPIDQEARILDVLRRARELGLTCFSSRPNPSGWISLQFYLTEDDIDRNF